MRTLGIVLVVLLAGIADAQTPVPSASTPASIEGVVVRLGTNEPLANATVELRTDAGLSVGTTTDRGGRFLLPNVAPGQYRLLANRSGYVRTEYAPEKATPGSRLTMTSGQRLTGLMIVMTPGGVITGRVTDRGKPSPGIVVEADKISYEGGQRVWTKVLSAGTDDRGEYHIFWLPPGRYYIHANLTDATPTGEKILVNPGGGDNPLITRGQVNLQSMERACFCGGFAAFWFSKSFPGLSDGEMHAPIFFPGTPDWQDATVIEVTPGAEMDGVDIHADTVPALHVRGILTGIPTQPAGNGAAGQRGQPPRPLVGLYSARPEAGQGYGAIQATTAATYTSVQADPNGAFDIPRVQPGTYLLRVAAGNTSAIASFEVRDRDVNGLSLALAPSDLSVAGRVVVERSAPVSPDPALASLNVGLFMERMDRFGTGFTNVAADGSFTRTNLLAGDYRISVGNGLLLSHWSTEAQVQTNNRNRVKSGLENAYVKSIKVKDTDVLSDELHLTGSLTGANQLVITIGTDGGTIEGRVVNNRQQPTGATVVLIPENGLRFHYVHDFVSTDASGKFVFKGIAPGDYKLFAWEGVEPGAWQNEEFVKGYEAQGRAVHVVGEGKTIPLGDVPSIH
jgi:hypothetical protein